MAENENNDRGFEQEADEKKETAEPESVDTILEKERQKSLRLLADYQNLEKQIIDRVNSRGDKIILDLILDRTLSLSRVSGGRCRGKPPRPPFHEGPKQPPSLPCESSDRDRPSRQFSTVPRLNDTGQIAGFECMGQTSHHSRAPRPTRCRATPNRPAQHLRIQACIDADRGLPSDTPVCHLLARREGERSKKSVRDPGEVTRSASGRCVRGKSSCRL